MNENNPNNNPSPDNQDYQLEIQRIQNEINKALAPEPPASYPATPLDVMPPHAGLTDEHIENHVPVSPMFSEQPTDSTTYYQETIKQEPQPTKSKPFKRIVAAVTAVCLLGGAGIGFAVGRTTQPKNIITAQGEPPTEKATFSFNDANPTPAAQPATVVSDLRTMSNQFVDIIQRVEPSVVAITTAEISSQQFFDAPFEQPSGSASGIIFHEDDEKVYIATNQHVINKVNSVKVSIMGSEPVPAKHVGSNANEDLAVISIQKSDLKNAGINQVTVARFGNSDDVQVGDLVLAIGNAFGQGNTATMGMISASEKEIQMGDRQTALSVLQTSATINFGNSGGPLVNLDGEIIGINTAKFSPAYGAEGMGFSISSNRAKPIIEGLMNRTGKAFLGISGSTITEEIAAAYGLPELGVFVNAVFADSAAAQANIKRTDIITSINGAAILTVEQLTETIQSYKVGDTLSIGLIRDGKTPMTVQATLTQYNDTDF